MDGLYVVFETTALSMLHVLSMYGVVCCVVLKRSSSTRAVRTVPAQ